MSRKIDRGYILNAMNIAESPKKSLQAVTWDGRSVKGVFRESERTLQADIGILILTSMGNIASTVMAKDAPEGKITFTKGEIDFASKFGLNSAIRKNFATLFEGSGYGELRSDIANVLSDSQKKDVYRALSSVYDKLELINQYINESDGASYDAINRLIEQITEVSKLCRDVYESALSSTSLIERKKHEKERGAATFAKAEDLIMAFNQMGWDISEALKETSLDGIKIKLPENASVEVGGVSPFSQDEVATFIFNYQQLSDEQKRTFSIPRLFEVYGDTAKKKIEHKFMADESEKHKSLKGLSEDLDKNFSSEAWRTTQLSGYGSLMRYSMEMMGFVHSADMAKAERETLGNADTGSIRLAGISGLELVRGDLQDENQLENLREEIKTPFLEAIALTVTSESGFKIDKTSPIVKNYMELISIEQGRTIVLPSSGMTPSGVGKSEDDFYVDIYKDVYKYMQEHHMAIDGKIVSEDMFVHLQDAGVTLDNLTPAKTDTPSVEPIKLDIAKLQEIIGDKENVELLESYLKIEGNEKFAEEHASLLLDGLDDTTKAGLISDEKYPLYCALAGVISDASKKKENAGKSVEEVWASAKDEIESSLAKDAEDDLFSEDEDSRTLNSVYRFGLFDTLVTNTAEKIKGKTFASNEQKRQTVANLVAEAKKEAGVEADKGKEFSDQVVDCVCNGTTAGNAYYADLFKKAREDILIARYQEYMDNLSKGLSELSDEKRTGAEQAIANWDNAIDSNDREALVKQAEAAAGRNEITDVTSKDEIINAYNESLNKKQPVVEIKKSTLGDKLEFDAQGLAKKLKPFNVKAGQKYLDGLIKAIKKAVIEERIVTDAKGNDQQGKVTPKTPGTPESDSGTPENSSENGGNGNGSYTPEELKEKAAFYVMGQALDQSLNDMIRTGGLTEEDKNRLLSEQQDMRNLFNLLAFGEDKDKKFTFNNGKNTIQCGKIGYIQQIIYSKATDPNFEINEDELALVLADGQDITIGARQERETDDMYIARIKSNPTIASIIRSLGSISSEVAYALVGITSTKDGKDGHFAGKVDDNILDALKDAKTPSEIKTILDSLNTTKFDMQTHKTTEGPIAKILRDAQLDLAVAKSRKELRERIKAYAKKPDNGIIDFSADKQTQKRQVQQFLNSEEVNKVPGMIYDTTIESNAIARKEILDRVADELYAEIDRGLTASNPNPVNPNPIDNPTTPQQEEPQQEVEPVVEEEVKEEKLEEQEVPFVIDYDAIVDKLIENNFNLTVLSMANEDALKQQKRAKLRNEFGVYPDRYKGLLPASLTEDVLNTIIEKYEERVREQQVEKPEEKPAKETKFEPLTVEDIKFDKFLFYGTDVNNNNYMQVILHAINYVRSKNGDYESFKRQIMGNSKLAEDDLKTIINDPDFQSDIEKYLPVKSAERVEEQSINKVQVVLDALKENGFEVDFTMGMPQKQIGIELNNAKYDNIRDVIKSLTEDEAKQITSQWIELYTQQGNVEMSY